jgi:plastocyanin
VRRAAALGVLAALVCAAPAWADQAIIAGFGSQYLTSEVTIDQGEVVTFQNTDVIEHDVVARANRPDGKPLFRSPLIGTGAAPVGGAEFLTTGVYEFFCSVHAASMTGKLTVTSAGAPQTRPGGGGGGSGGGGDSGGGSGEQLDLSVAIADKRLADVRKRKALRISVTLNKGATVSLSSKSGKTKLGSAKRALKAGKSVVSVKLTKAGLKLVKKSRSLKIEISGKAGDGSGESAAGGAKKLS